MTDPTMDDLAHLVRRLAHSLRKAAPDNEMPEKALDYLRRVGLEASILRDSKEASKPMPMKTCEPSIPSAGVCKHGFNLMTGCPFGESQEASKVGAFGRTPEMIRFQNMMDAGDEE